MTRQQETWTSRRLLHWTTEYFQKRSIDNPRLSAEMLLAHVLEVGRLKLYMDPDRPTSELERAAFRDLVERAAKHEPVDYLVGLAPFFAMQFEVNPDVLIPRPSTETIVEHVLQHARRTPGFQHPSVADICTGSGAIAVSLAKHMPQCRVTATDISEKAIAVATRNAERHGVTERIEFRQGDLLAPLGMQRVRYLISNPPYISDAEWAEVEPNVKDYEPTLALRGGVDGLDLIRKLITAAPKHLEQPGQLVLEFATSQHKQVVELAQQAGFKRTQILGDHEGLPRVLVADV